MDSINVCIPTLNSFDTLLRLLESYTTQTVKANSVVILDNSAGKFPTEAARAITSDVDVRVMPQNLGVAASWNWFMKNIQGVNFILNDDVEMHARTLEAMLSYIPNYPHTFLYAGGAYANMFSFFYVPKSVYEVVGDFDETFFPAYFEDNDYCKRLQLSGIPIQIVPEATYSHVGSSTLKKYTSDQSAYHHTRFSENAGYYVRKWGGMPHEEKFPTPFNIAKES